MRVALTVLAALLLGGRCDVPMPDNDLVLEGPHPHGGDVWHIGQDVRSCEFLDFYRVLPPCGTVEATLRPGYHETSGVYDVPYTLPEDWPADEAYVSKYITMDGSSYWWRRPSMLMRIKSVGDRLPSRIPIPQTVMTVESGPECEQPAKFGNPPEWESYEAVHNWEALFWNCEPHPVTGSTVIQVQWFYAFAATDCDLAYQPWWCWDGTPAGFGREQGIAAHDINAGASNTPYGQTEIDCRDAEPWESCLGVVQ